MDRFLILKDSHMICDDTFQKVKRAETFLLQRYQSGELLDMLLTHFAIAMERVHKKEQLGAIGDTVLQELTSHEEYSQCLEVLEQLYQVTYMTLPKEEEPYILLHLLNVINEEKGVK